MGHRFLVFWLGWGQTELRGKLWGICACSYLFRKQIVDEYIQTTTVLADAKECYSRA
jgi:hypothetical protein